MPKEYVSSELRKFVFERAAGCCEYCRSQARFAPEPFSIEHIVPVSSGGSTAESNLALSCQGCNNYKAARTSATDSITGSTTTLFHPRLQLWNEHFAWAEAYTTILGLTSAGRATVQALRLNREGLINLRWVLYGAGEHPPKESDAVN